MRISTLLAGIAIGAMLPAVAQAAPGEAQAAGAAAVADATPANTLGEVVVTARKREEKLQDVPIAVTAMNSALIEREQMNTVQDIAAFSPGLVINSDAVGRAFLSIRGVGTTLIDTVQPGVGIFIDDVYMPDTSYLYSPLVDVERIEVLRGPQGSLFGNNTLGGAISVVTRQPSDAFHAMLSADYAGPDDYYTVTGSVSGPIIPGVLDARLAASTHNQDGFEKNVLAGGWANPLNTETVTGALRWTVSPDATLTLNAYYNREHGGETPYVDVSGPKDMSENATLNVNSLASYIYRDVNLKGEFNVQPIATKITAIAAYDNRDGGAYGDGDFGPVDFLRAGGTNTLNTYSGEVRFDTRYNDSLSSLFGVFASDSTTDVTTIETIVPYSLTAVTPATSTTQAAAVFGTLFWKLPDAFELDAGMRYDHQSVAASNADATYRANELEPRFTLNKHWTANSMTYASVSRGFRGGGSNGAGAPNPIYKGDTVWTYELGEKYETSDHKLILDADVFYNNYSNYIGQNSLAPSTSGVGFVAINLNSGQVESYGAELEAQYHPTPRWDFSGQLTLMHARITNGSEYVETTDMPLPTSRILFVPDWDFTLNGGYTQPLGDDQALRFDATVIAKGDRVGSTLSPASVPVMPAYALVNGDITWTRGHVALSVFGTNLTDTKYMTSYLDGSLLAVATSGVFHYNLSIPADRRRVGVRVKYAF